MALTFTPSRTAGPRGGLAAAALQFGQTVPVAEPLFVISEEIDAAILAHARSSQEEVAGILAGRVWSDGGTAAIVSIEAAIRAEQHVETTAVHVTFKPQAWDAIAAELDKLGSDMLVVGWYHTHPDLGAFFSSTDRATQARAFRHPWQIGIVLDPVRNERVAYRGAESEPVPLGHMVRPLMPAPLPPSIRSIDPPPRSRLRPIAIGLAASLALALWLGLRWGRARDGLPRG